MAAPQSVLSTAPVLSREKLFIITLVRKAGGAPEVRSCSGHSTVYPTTPASGAPIDGPPVAPCPCGPSKLSDPVAPLEAIKVAHDLKTSTAFKSDLYPVLSLTVDVSSQDLVMIATPTYFDWESVIHYEGFTLSMGNDKSLFIKFPRAFDWLTDDFTSSVVALIELAENILDCDRVFVAVDRSVSELNNLARSLMYAGFSICPSPLPNGNTDKYLLLEYETE